MSPPAIIFAIDPGPERSACVLYSAETRTVDWFEILANADVIAAFRNIMPDRACWIESVASYGMPVGREVFETCIWIGKFEAWWEASGRHPAQRMTRLQVKLAICHDSRAKDSNIRAALIDHFGPGKEKAIGNKKHPGPLYGVKRDIWAALALAVAASQRGRE